MATNVRLLTWFAIYWRPPTVARGLLGRVLLLLSVLAAISPAAAPAAEAAACCDFAQMYGPYGALVGTASPDLILGISSCLPDQTVIDFLKIDHRAQINWGDGSGWQTSGVQASDCAAALYCTFQGSGHAGSGTYGVQVKYYQLGIGTRHQVSRSTFIKFTAYRDRSGKLDGRSAGRNQGRQAECTDHTGHARLRGIRIQLALHRRAGFSGNLE